eukprot:gene7347-468_t
MRVDTGGPNKYSETLPRFAKTETRTAIYNCVCETAVQLSGGLNLRDSHIRVLEGRSSRTRNVVEKFGMASLGAPAFLAQAALSASSAPEIPSLAFKRTQRSLTFDVSCMSGPPAVPDVVPCQVSVNLTAYTPSQALGGEEKLICIFSPGFLVDPASYSSYCKALASQGIPTVVYKKIGESPSNPYDDVTSAEVLQAVMQWSASAPELEAAGKVSSGAASPTFSGAETGSRATPVHSLLAGHSRGAKISALAACSGGLAGISIAGLMLLDPVDGSYDMVEGIRYPSSLPGLQECKPPALVVGLAKNGVCIPKSANYKKFFEALTNGELLDKRAAQAGHFSVLDQLTFLQGSVCSLGKADRSKVRETSQAMLLLWASYLRASLAMASAKQAAPVDAEVVGDLQRKIVDVCEGSGLQYSFTI